MNSVTSGIIGAFVAMLLTAYIAKRVGKAGPAGELRFGPFAWVLAVLSLSFSLLGLVYILFSGEDEGFWPCFGLCVGFGGVAIYCFMEAAFVRGTYDANEIHFYTPWTGQKHELWCELESVQLSETWGWYILTFKTGVKIRLSPLLRGHLSALEAANWQKE